MTSILTSVAIFLVTFLIQLLLVRLFRKLHVHVFTTFILYAFGFLFLYRVIHLRELPYASLLVYILLTLLLITVSFVPLLGQRSPSSIIITMLQKKRLSYAKLQSAFDEEYMILRRLEDLVHTGLVYKHEQRYVISPLGSFFDKFLSTIGRLMGLKI